MNTRALFLLICAICFFTFSCSRVSAAYYNWQAYNGNGVAGAVGNATLQMSNNQYTVYANFIKGIGSFIENFVIYIDCAPGGFTSTASLSDKGTALETAVSGFGLNRSTATFAPGFAADYAIALGINSGSALYKLVNDATGPHLQIVTEALNFVHTDSPNHPSYSFQFDWAYLGLPNKNTNFFKFETTYITSNGYRTLESFEGLTGNRGYDFVTFTNFDTYGVPPIPESTNIALALFGGIVLTVGLGKRARSYFKQKPRSTSRMG
jgi:hypothetical protein